MILATGVTGAAMATYCAAQPELPDCVAYMARMVAMEPWLQGLLVVEIVAIAAFILSYRIKTGKWRQ